MTPKAFKEMRRLVTSTNAWTDKAKNDLEKERGNFKGASCSVGGPQSRGGGDAKFSQDEVCREISQEVERTYLKERRAELEATRLAEVHARKEEVAALKACRVAEKGPLL